MASFETHLSGAALVSAMSASAAVVSQWCSIEQGVLLFFLGALGGVLPDIDSDTSRPVIWLFNVLAAAACALFLWLATPWLASWSSSGGSRIVWSWLGMALVWLLAGPLAMRIFFRFTIHRGLFHSLLAALFFGLATVCIAWALAQQPAPFSWLCGLFVAGGFVVHLLLDEVYAVDFNGVRLKKSFGTAIKPFSVDNWSGSLMLALVCGALWYFAPSTEGLVQELQWLALLGR